MLTDFEEEKTEDDELLKETPRIDVKKEIVINDNISKNFTETYSNMKSADSHFGIEMDDDSINKQKMAAAVEKERIIEN